MPTRNEGFPPYMVACTTSLLLAARCSASLLHASAPGDVCNYLPTPRTLSRMTPTRRLGVALVCACATTVGLAFVPNVGTGCAAFRARQGVEARNTVIPSSHHHSSFAGSPIIHAGRAAGPRRHGNFAKRGRNGRGRRCVCWYSSNVQSGNTEKSAKLGVLMLMRGPPDQQ